MFIQKSLFSNRHIFDIVFWRCSRSVKISLGDENTIEHNNKLVY